MNSLIITLISILISVIIVFQFRFGKLVGKFDEFEDRVKEALQDVKSDVRANRVNYQNLLMALNTINKGQTPERKRRRKPKAKKMLPERESRKMEYPVEEIPEEFTPEEWDELSEAFKNVDIETLNKIADEVLADIEPKGNPVTIEELKRFKAYKDKLVKKKMLTAEEFQDFRDIYEKIRVDLPRKNREKFETVIWGLVGFTIGLGLGYTISGMLKNK